VRACRSAESDHVQLSLCLCLSSCTSLSFSLFLSLCLCLCLSVSLSLCLSVSLSPCLSLALSLSLSLSLRIRLRAVNAAKSCCMPASLIRVHLGRGALTLSLSLSLCLSLLLHLSSSGVQIFAASSCLLDVSSVMRRRRARGHLNSTSLRSAGRPLLCQSRRAESVSLWLCLCLCVCLCGSVCVLSTRPRVAACRRVYEFTWAQRLFVRRVF